jgi:LemA protein
LLIAIPAYIAFATHNRLVALDQRCDTAFSDIDAHLKHRHNLIPPLVEAVRGFTKHEGDILLGVTEARAAALQAATPEMQLSAEQNLTQNINALIGMAERYPELKASTHFADLRWEIVMPRTGSPPRAASTTWRSKNTRPLCASSPAATSVACPG